MAVYTGEITRPQVSANALFDELILGTSGTRPSTANTPQISGTAFTRLISWQDTTCPGTVTLYSPVDGSFVIHPVQHNEDGFTIYRRDIPTDWIWDGTTSGYVVAGQVAPNSTSFSDNSQFAGRYSYVVVANNTSVAGGGDAVPAAQVTITLLKASKIVYPNGGECIPYGQAIDVLWQTVGSGLPAVDLKVSADGGATYITAATAVYNLGHYLLGQPATGSNYRIKVVPYEGTPLMPIEAYADYSDGSFTVWGIDEASTVCVPMFSCDTPTLSLQIQWDTSIATDGQDVVEVYEPGEVPGIDTPDIATGISQGTHHLVTWHGVCLPQPGTWHFVEKSTKVGSGVVASNLKSKYVAECMSCPPPCHPPCELE